MTSAFDADESASENVFELLSTSHPGLAVARKARRLAALTTFTPDGCCGLIAAHRRAVRALQSSEQAVARIRKAEDRFCRRSSREKYEEQIGALRRSLGSSAADLALLRAEDDFFAATVALLAFRPSSARSAERKRRYLISCDRVRAIYAMSGAPVFIQALCERLSDVR